MRPRFQCVWLGFLAIAAALTLAGCTDTPTPASGAPKRAGQPSASYDAAGKLRKLEYDRNKDGKVDTWGYMDGSRVVRIEVDENGDGTVDRWEYHRAAGSGAAANPGSPTTGVDATVERIERATRLDGKVSRTEFFDKGLLATIEEDTDGDGRVDKWETYAGGSLSVMALDTAKRGTPDRRLVYRPDGSLDHIEADPAGSGIFTPLKP